MTPRVDLETLMGTVGYLGLFAMVFTGTGLLVGFGLLGDSLLSTATLLALQDVLAIVAVSAALVAGEFWRGQR